MEREEYEELVKEFEERLAIEEALWQEIDDDPPAAHPFVVCLPGTYKAYFNIH